MCLNFLASLEDGLLLRYGRDLEVFYSRGLLIYWTSERLGNHNSIWDGDDTTDVSSV